MISKNRTRQMLLIVISLVLAFIINRQITAVKSEYMKLNFNKELEDKIAQAISRNRRLQQELIRAQSLSYKELQARKQLLLGFPEEEVFVLDKPTYKPPPLKQVRVID